MILNSLLFLQTYSEIHNSTSKLLNFINSLVHQFRVDLFPVDVKAFAFENFNEQINSSSNKIKFLNCINMRLELNYIFIVFFNDNA